MQPRPTPNSPAMRASAAALTALVAAAPSSATAAESFFEGFDRIDPDRWYVSDGWANGAWQNCTWRAANVTAQDGILRLAYRATPDGPHSFSCGEIRTRAAFGYGTYEVRMKTARGSGLNAAFFTYTGPTDGRPHDEIDIEVLTRDTSAVSLNTYVSSAPTNGLRVPLPAASDDGFMSYGFTWSQTGITWFVEGEVVHQTQAGTNLPEHPQGIFASFWSSDTFTDWMGPFEPPAEELALLVDWISFTAEGDPCQHPQSLLCPE